MSVAVTPQKVGSTGSMVVHFTKPMPEKFSVPFWNQGRFFAAAVLALGVFLAFVAVHVFVTSDDVWAGVLISVAALVMAFSSYDRYFMWFKEQERKYVKEVVVPFFKRELFAPVPAWLTNAGLVVHGGEVPRLYDDFNGELLYYDFYDGGNSRSGQWMRAYQVAEDGTLSDSGKAYSVGFTFVGKDTVKVTYLVVES